MELNIERINELYHKSQSVGLTEKEKEEQAHLREEYIKAIRQNLRGTLDRVSFVNPDGSVTKAGDHSMGTHKVNAEEEISETMSETGTDTEEATVIKRSFYREVYDEE